MDTEHDRPEPDSTRFSEVAQAPPTQPGTGHADALPSTWPTVLGIVCLILGGLGLAGGMCGLTMSVLGSSMASAQGAGNEMSGRMLAFTAVGTVFQMALSAGLLVSGIGVLRQRSWGVLASKIWAIAKIIVSGVSLVVQMALGISTDVLADSGMNWSEESIRVMTWLFGGIGLIWALILPVFVLVWFARPVIKQEIADWD